MLNQTKTESVATMALEPTQLLQLVLDTIPQHVFWKDLNSVYLGCNHLFAQQAGLSNPSEIVGLTDFHLPWTEEKAEFYRECDRRVMDSNRAEVGIIESQIDSAGKPFWVETNKVPLLDEQGRVIGILGSFHDVTKIKEAEHSLQRSKELLEKRVYDRTRELSHLAQHDNLTNLANRAYFLHLLNEDA